MKMVKSLLLGSAAGLVAIVGAQAADLPVKAKAVQYVKICTLYGDGYYYIPGSDTCIKVGGYIRADYGYNNTGARTANYSGVAGTQTRVQNDFSTRHRANIQMDARTQSAYGTVRAFMSVHVNNENLGTETVNLSRGFIQFAGFTLGHTKSFTDTFSLGDNYALQQVQNEYSTGANGVNQIAYTAEFGSGMSLTVGADEPTRKPSFNFAAASMGTGAALTDSHKGMSFPDPYLAFKIQQAWGYWGTTVLAHDASATYYGATTPTGHPGDRWGYAILNGGELKLPWIAPGDRIGFEFNYTMGAPGYAVKNLSNPGLYGSGNQVAIGWLADAVYTGTAGTALELTEVWSLGAGYEHYWNSNLRTSLYGSYAQIRYNNTARAWFAAAAGPACGAPIAGVAASAFVAVAGNSCNPNFDFWTAGTRTIWSPLAGLNLGVDIYYTRIKTAFGGTAALAANGARPAGTYAISDQGIWSAIFRAQRNFGAGD
jgi:hypothetical protein